MNRNNTEQLIVGALKHKKASRYIGVSDITLRRLVEKGLIKPNRGTRHLLYAIVELDRFLAAN